MAPGEGVCLFTAGRYAGPVAWCCCIFGSRAWWLPVFAVRHSTVVSKRQVKSHIATQAFPLTKSSQHVQLRAGDSVGHEAVAGPTSRAESPAAVASQEVDRRCQLPGSRSFAPLDHSELPAGRCPNQTRAASIRLPNCKSHEAGDRRHIDSLRSSAETGALTASFVVVGGQTCYSGEVRKAASPNAEAEGAVPQQPGEIPHAADTKAAKDGGRGCEDEGGDCSPASAERPLGG